MQKYVTDTHALLWYLFRSKRLSSKATAIFNAIDAGQGQIHIHAIVLVEIVYLMEKAKIPQKAIKTVIDLLAGHPRTILSVRSHPKPFAHYSQYPERKFSICPIELLLRPPSNWTCHS
ncbi:MAG: PIN domain-containing protein [bacterium]